MQVGVRYVHLVRRAKCINWMRQNTNAAIYKATTVYVITSIRCVEALKVYTSSNFKSQASR